MTTISKNLVTLWVSPLILSPHPSKFGVHKPCESGDITFFIFSRDHDIEESRDFVGGVLSSCVTTLLSLGSIGPMELEIMTFVISVPIPIPIPMPRFQCRGLQMAFYLT